MKRKIGYIAIYMADMAGVVYRCRDIFADYLFLAYLLLAGAEL